MIDLRRSVDVVVVGAGPVGLFATYCAGFRGLSVVVVDAYEAPGGQVTALYPNKRIWDVAAVPGITGGDFIANLLRQADEYAPEYRFGVRVVSLRAAEEADGVIVGLSDGNLIGTRAVVLATGVGGIEPRPLPVGHEWLGRGVTYAVPDPAEHAGEDVVVVGGGDSALDWAIELAATARSVTVVHRRRSFRAHAASVARAGDLGVEMITDAEVVSVDGDERVRSVTVSRDAEQRSLPAGLVVGALGLLSDVGPLREWGLEMHDRRIVVDRSMHTSMQAVFAAGDATWYPGKVALLATGFGEAATAVNNAALLLDPEAELAPGHSTDKRAEAVPVPQA